MKDWPKRSSKASQNNHHANKTGIGIPTLALLGRNPILRRWQKLIMDPILKFTLGTIVVFATSYFSAMLATKRAYKEKWWEHKQKAYSDVIEALYDLLDVSTSKFDELVTGQDLNEKETEELERKRVKAYLFLSKSIDLGEFFISQKSVGILQEMRKKHGNLRNEADSAFEYLDSEIGHYKNYIDQFCRCAKKDLKI